MAKLTKEVFIESLKEMTILEVKELVDALKEEFGVDPSAVAAAPAAGAAAGAGAAAAGAEAVPPFSSTDTSYALPLTVMV